MSNPREVRRINVGWKFHRGPQDGAWLKGHDDSAWRDVTLPHDWSVEEPFDQAHSSGTGYVAAGVGVYRHRFFLEGPAAGRRVLLTFEGVYNHAQVWCNGYFLGGRPSGYATFSFDLTDVADWGPAGNVVTVQVNHKDTADSRWFTGSGIYRDVTLTLTGPVSLARHGVFFTTPEVGADRVRAAVECRIDNTGSQPAVLEVRQTLWDAEGRAAGSARASTTLAPGSRSHRVDLAFEVPAPRLWSPDHPELYRLETELWLEGRVVDSVAQVVGLRTFVFDADRGFSLNGVGLKLKGVCLHHDAGCLGAAVPRSVWKKRLDSLKDLGCNAIRTSHNPPSPALLDLCDELGFLVIDEAFDEWEGVKNKWSTGHNVYPPKHFGAFEDFPEWGERDLKDMVLRDRNHPSIVLWSIGNEIDYPNDPYCHPSFAEMTGNNDANKPAAERQYDPTRPNAERLVPIARRLTAWVKDCDPTRPVTVALAFPELSNLTGLAAEVDVVGYNYKEHLYRDDHRRFPGRPIFGSENGGHLAAWKAVEELDHNAGMFVWTGIDYLGEARGWPVRAAGAGFLDLAGTRKARFFFFRSLWSAEPTLQLASRVLPADGSALPPWDLGTLSWEPGAEGKREVLAFTNSDQAELFLNGRSLGVQKRSESPDRYLRWKTPFEAGTLTVRARFSDGSVQESSLVTPGAAAQIRLRADRAELRADGEDLTELELEVTDGAGNVLEVSPHPLTVTVEGPGRLRGLENGDIQDLTAYTSSSRRVVHRRLVAYVATTGAPGTIVVRAEAPGLKGAEVRLRTTS